MENLIGFSAFLPASHVKLLRLSLSVGRWGQGLISASARSQDALWVDGVGKVRKGSNGGREPSTHPTFLPSGIQEGSEIPAVG